MQLSVKFDPLQKRVAWGCLAWLGFSTLLGFNGGEVGLALFHLSALAVVAFSYTLPGPRGILFGLLASGVGLLFCFRDPSASREYFFCQTSVFVLLGFLPSIFSRAEERRRMEKQIIMEYSREKLDKLQKELNELQTELQMELERAKVVVTLLKGMAA